MGGVVPTRNISHGDHAVCAKLETEGQESMSTLLVAIEGIEPKSLAGFRRRVEKYNTVKSQWQSLQQKLHSQAPRPKR